jgi:hypothetical protein
MRQNKKLV